MTEVAMELLMSLAPEAAAPVEPIEIETLVRRTLAGDTSAFERIVRLHERRVMSLSLRMLGDPDAAQDAAQESFLRAFRYIHRLDLQKPLEPWLVQITVNVCRDMMRKKQRLQSTFSEVSTSDIEPRDEAPSPHDGLLGQQEQQALRQALETLPEKERLALLLRDVEGLSTAEVAHMLGSSETTVRSQICRGRLRLKGAWERLTGGKR